MQNFWITVEVIAAIAAYFAPTLIALKRRVTNRGSVFVVNWLLGFTVIGWIVALAMALRTTTLPRPPRPPGAPYGYPGMRPGAPRG